MKNNFEKLQDKLLAVINDDPELTHDYQHVQRILNEHINYYFDNYLEFALAMDVGLPLWSWQQNLRKQCEKDLALINNRLETCTKEDYRDAV